MIDSMLPPETTALLTASGHEAWTPAHLGAHNLPDDALIQIASADNMVIVTENAVDFAAVSCPVLLVRKAWWPGGSLAGRLSAAIQRWAVINPEPGPWSHWLPEALR